MEVLSSRVVLYPSDLDAALTFYDEVLGLHRFREYGGDRVAGVVYFLGGGYLEVTAGDEASPRGPVRLWLQVRDIDREHGRLAAAGATIALPPTDMPWGLREMDVAGPDGVSLRIVEVREDHPLRRRT